MRALLTADAVGGVWTYAVELIGGLAELGVEVDLAVMGPAPSREQRQGLPDLASYHHAPFTLEWMDEPWEDVERAGEWLLTLAEDGEVELVHLNGYAHGSTPFGVPVLVVGHSCVLSWHAAVGATAGAQWDLYGTRVAAGLEAADAVAAPTRAMLVELERLYRFEGERFVIPNGRAAAGVEPRGKQPYVLGVGRVWDEAKNLAALERVAPALAWPVLVAGEGGSLGRVGDDALRGLYAHASVFASPARYEPFGLAALEAALAGCALVLGDIPSLREVWDDAALYVDPFDDEELAAALRRVIGEETLRKRLAEAARRRGRRYSRERMAVAYADLYDRLAVPALLEASA